MNTEKPIYEQILRGLKDGRLAEDFALRGAEDADGISFTDGALDGIVLYHTGRTELDAQGSRLMLRAVKYAAAGQFAEADEAFAELGRSFRAVSIIDAVQDYVMANSERFSAGSIFQTGMYLALHSADRESVKYGLCLLELIELKDEGAKEVIRRLGLSDEFTLFVVWNMLKWENGNSEIFTLIKKVRGWGRIHALTRLEPETPEISEWILLHGLDNDILPAYSALTVWEKADVPGRLRGALAPEAFSAIGRVLDALLDEGPVPGISGVEDPEEDILAYLSAAEEFPLEAEDYDTIFTLMSWAMDEDVSLPPVADACGALLSDPVCGEIVATAAAEGRFLPLARALGLLENEEWEESEEEEE